MDDKQALVGGTSPSAPPQTVPPPYTPPSGGYGTTGGGYQSAGYAAPASAPGYYQPQQQQHTTVVVTHRQPVHTVARMEIKPPNYLAMSILSMLFCCFLFGLIALIFSVQSDSAWARGDREEAYRLSSAARRWNIITIAVGVFFTGGWLIAVIAGAVVSTNNTYYY